MMIGRLTCRICNRVTDICIGGKGMAGCGESLDQRCPRCGETSWKKTYWTNKMVDGHDHCVFVVDEELV